MSISLLCLALVVFQESRGEPEAGQIAVAKVVMNRADMRKLPVCEVLTEKGQFSWNVRHYVGRTRVGGGSQPTLYRDRLPTHRKGWAKALNSAEKAQKMPGNMQRVEFFHAAYVDPGWSRRYRKVFRIGNHVFYARREGYNGAKAT